eukprot:3941097-Amphidinium_carterae.1
MLEDEEGALPHEEEETDMLDDDETDYIVYRLLDKVDLLLKEQKRRQRQLQQLTMDVHAIKMHIAAKGSSKCAPKTPGMYHAKGSGKEAAKG